MAITIRDTEKHEEMLSKLKELTKTSTMSKALVQGGYDALKYQELYQKERMLNEKLKRKLYDNELAVNDYLDALKGLQSIVE
ncbi:hypothetical protein ACED56_12320 [Vibrio splendidus]|uniref:hypothetical protein n=1 Tax=Vibrio splendidus TaxID=29497 RepID=UPI00076A1FC1|nr:hypothetical protein [Vibrio splendidus]OBT31114.1 hypothetical protein A9262_10705 [Vibrio splendidus]PHX06116.1 hypothetical protein VSPL_25770 [Vibrio splendidus]PTP74933.1 hypothetical protein CWO00_14370 [Vibrio splendidus]